jgi:hypothetical protein
MHQYASQNVQGYFRFPSTPFVASEAAALVAEAKNAPFNAQTLAHRPARFLASSTSPEACFSDTSMCVTHGAIRPAEFDVVPFQLMKNMPFVHQSLKGFILFIYLFFCIFRALFRFSCLSFWRSCIVCLFRCIQHLGFFSMFSDTLVELRIAADATATVCESIRPKKAELLQTLGQDCFGYLRFDLGSITGNSKFMIFLLLCRSLPYFQNLFFFLGGLFEQSYLLVFTCTLLRSRRATHIPPPLFDLCPSTRGPKTPSSSRIARCRRARPHCSPSVLPLVYNCLSLVHTEVYIFICFFGLAGQEAVIDISTLAPKFLERISVQKRVSLMLNDLDNEVEIDYHSRHASGNLCVWCLLMCDLGFLFISGFLVCR